jgi:hypothetical protein
MESSFFVRIFSSDMAHRTCVPVEPGYCSNLPYNITTLPNILGHTTRLQVDPVINTLK